jgi:hypothetical protein
MCRKIIAIVAAICCLSTSSLMAQSAQKPRQAKPKKPASAAAPKPEAAKPPAPPRHSDVRFKTTYTADGMKTETVTYIKGQRERFEFQDMVLLKQHDQQRTVQISRAANTYLVVPDAAPAAPAIPDAAAPPKPSGVVTMVTTISDTGERKSIFGQQARRVKTTIDKQPAPGACDATKQRIETDGWYIDSPIAPAASNEPLADAAAPAGACADQIQATVNGDAKAMGFPIAYTTTVVGDGGTSVLASMEVSDYELTTLDPALFEIPTGLNAATDLHQLSKALSDAHEAKLAAADTEAVSSPRPRTPGVVRIGVPELTNKTATTVDTRALRQRLVSTLIEAKFEAEPMAAASQDDLQKRAAELGYDYVLLADVTDLKVSKPGKFGGMMQAASSVAGGSKGPQEKTESALAVKLIQPDGKQLVSTTSKGKDGSGFTLKTGLGLAKFAGGMYLSMMFSGPQMLAQLNGVEVENLGGITLLGNPMLQQMQAGGLSGLGKRGGMDQTAGAASFLFQQVMAMNSSSGLGGVPGEGPSFDESLGEALQNAAKVVQKTLQKK